MINSNSYKNASNISDKENDIDDNDLYIVIVNTLIVVLIFIIIPLVLFIYQMTIRIKIMSSYQSYNNIPVINSIYNRYTYRGVRNV